MSAPNPRRPPVLVTGAAGFIGSALCRRLLDAGESVVAYDDLSRGKREYVPDGIALVQADIRDRDRMKATIAETRPASVIHLAAMHFIPDCVARPADTLDINVHGTRVVLDSCRGTSVRKIIFASSAAVYAPTDAPCVEDDTPLAPLEVYGESKLAAEQLLRAFHAETGIAATILRLFNAVGRRETNPHVIPHIFESLQASDTVALGNMAPRRDYVDTRDIADAIVAATNHADGLQVLNVGTGAAHSVSDVIDLLRGILRRPIAVQQAPSRTRSNERMLLVADPRRAQEHIGWSARISFKETLQDLVLAYGL